MAVALPPPGVPRPVVGAPPAPSVALQQWVAAHYAPALRAGVLSRLARNPTRAAQLTLPNVGDLLHPGGFDISRYHFPAAPAPAVGTTTTGPSTTAAPANPYAAYPDYAQATLRQMDADRLAAQQNATTTAAWLSPALQALQAGQQQAQSAYATTLAGLYGSQGGVGLAQVAPASPGGVVASPANALLAAQQQAAPLHAAAQQQLGATQSLLGNLRVGDVAQGALGNLAWQASQIPTVWEVNKQKYLSDLDKALTDAQQQAASDAAKLAEQQREFAIKTSTTLRGQDIGVIKPRLDYALGLAKLGASPSTLSKVTEGVIPVSAGTSIPGYQTVTAADGNTYALKQPASSTPKAAKAPSNWYAGPKRPELIRAGYVATPVTVGGKKGFQYVKAGASSAASASKPPSTTVVTGLAKSFADLWSGKPQSLSNPTGTPGSSVKPAPQATADVINWLRRYHEQFPGKKGLASLMTIVQSVDPNAYKLAQNWWSGQRANLAQLWP